MAQLVCGAREDLTARLKTNYGESQDSVGLAANGFLVEIWSSQNGGFTMLYTTPQGQSCLFATGEHWQRIENQVKPNEPPPI